MQACAPRIWIEADPACSMLAVRSRAHAHCERARQSRADHIPYHDTTHPRLFSGCWRKSWHVQVKVSPYKSYNLS
jgi:hypothetical protein